MKIITEKLEGPVTLTENTKLFGLIGGTTTVSQDIRLEHHGLISGDLILEKGCEVILRGMVIRDVINRGGYLKIFGMVVGKVSQEKGDIFVDPQAIVRGGIH